MDATMTLKLKQLFQTRLHSAMRLYLDTCARCGVCVEACHVYASMPQARYTAVGRAEVIRKIFKTYFTPGRQDRALARGGHPAGRCRPGPGPGRRLVLHGLPALHDLLPLRDRHADDHVHRQGPADRRGQGAEAAHHARRHVHRQGRGDRGNQAGLRPGGAGPDARDPGAVAVAARRTRR